MENHLRKLSLKFRAPASCIFPVISQLLPRSTFFVTFRLNICILNIDFFFNLQVSSFGTSKQKFIFYNAKLQLKISNVPSALVQLDDSRVGCDQNLENFVECPLTDDV